MPCLEKTLGVWMVPTLGFEISSNALGYEFPLLKRVFDGYRPVMQKYADELRDLILSRKLESVQQDEVDEVTPFWGNAYFHPGDARLTYARPVMRCAGSAVRPQDKRHAAVPRG